MTRSVNILVIEDLRTDFELAKRAISESVGDCTFRRVETQDDFLGAIESFQPDVILSDYSLPRFNGMKALKLSLEHAPHTPFIIWTGSMSEDVAVECMKAGASDYILKENIKRLGPAVAHALEERRLSLEHRQAEEKVRAQERRFRALIENSLDNISILAEDGSLLWENPAVNRTLGYEQDEFIGRNMFELMHPDDFQWTQDAFARLLKTPEAHEKGVFRLLHQDGTWRWIEAVATNLLNEPSVQGIVINYRDITQRKEAEIELRQRNEDLALINVINDAVIRGENINAIMKLIAKEMKRIFGGDAYSLYMLTPDGHSVTMQQNLLPSDVNKKIEQLIGSTIPLVQIPIQEGGFFEQVLHGKRGLIISEPKEIQNFITEFTGATFLGKAARETIRKLIPQIYEVLSIRSAILVPLMVSGKVMGFLDISSPNLFTPNDLERIENIARQLTTAIQRQQANDRIVRSEKFLQNIQDALSASIAILDKTGTIVRVNAAWRKFAEQNNLIHQNYGIGSNYLDICDSASGPYAEEAPEVARLIREAIADRKKQAQIEYPCHSPGEKRWFNLKITTFMEEDQTWVVLAHENITDRKLAEEAIKETSEQFRTLFEASPEAIMILDPHGDWPILDCNELACSMNGYTREELIGQSINIFNLTPGHIDERTGYLDSIRQAGVLRYETLHRRKDGSVFPIEVSTSLITLGGREVILGIDRDITERKEAETKIYESEERFRQLAENIQEVFWIVDVSSGEEIYLSPAIQDIWGRPVDDFMQNANTFIESILPEDRDMVLDALNKQKAGQHTVMEYRIRRPDGTVRWIWDRAFPIFDVSGNLTRVAGVAADITERKQAEDAVRESQVRLAGVVNTAMDAVITVDAGQNIILFNPAAERIFGCKKEDVLGQPLSRFIPDRYQASHKQHINNFGQTGVTNRDMGHLGALSGMRADGSEFPIEASISHIETGGQHLYTVILRDITERKRAEEALRQSEERYRQLLNVAPVGVVVHLNGKLVFANEAAARIVGANSPEILIGMPVMDFVHPEERKYAIESLGYVLRGEKGWRPREERFVRLDGSIVHVEVTATALTYMGRPAVQVIVQDITDRKQAEKDIERHLAEMQALYENGLAVGQLLKPQEIGERIIKTFSNHLSWHHVTIRLLKENSDDLELVAFSLPHLDVEMSDTARERLSKNVSKVGEGLSGWVVQTGNPLRTNNVAKYPQYVGTYENIQSGLYMPLKIGERVLGVISVESEEADAFSAQDERLLATLASQAAIAFENARLYQASQLELAERKRVEDALRTSETHYRELADSITDVFFELDHNLRYSHWNKASEILTGVPSKHAIGKKLHEIFGESAEQKRIEKIYEDVLTSLKPRTFETQFVLSGESRSFEVTAYPSTRGVSVVAKDVTDRKRSEVILQKRFELIEYSAQHSLPELMQKAIDEISSLTESEVAFFHLVEPDQNTLGMQTWSTNALKLFHVPASEGMHLPLNQAGVWAEAARRRRSIIQNDLESLSNRGRLPEGHVKITREMVVPIIRNEKIMAVMGIANKAKEYTQRDLETAERLADYVWDIAERKRMETALADERNQLAKRVDERTAELIRANSNLARALRVKDEFLANMSHELRTPLNAILGLSESLAEQIAGPLNDKQLKYITTIGESGHHLLSLINDILDLAKIEAGQITLDITKVDIHAVSQASLRMVKQLAQKKNQEMLLNVDQNIGLIWADERRLKQMMVNLLSNAVKFTAENGQLGLDVHGDYDENRVEITVWDNGIGIHENDLQRLFQPFVQLDSGLARESTGTGLGLALVSQMARLHGGSVNVASEPGKGSRFTINLPWEPALARDVVDRLKTTGKLSEKAAQLRNKKKILLIEDTVDVVMMISDYLETAGYNVITAQDGVEGIEQAQQIQPDLILMDIQMPRMDGIEATKKLRADPMFRYVPIIALTALAMPNDRERCIAAGMDEYISKPVNLRGLVKIIQKCLSAGEEKTRPV